MLATILGVDIATLAAMPAIIYWVHVSRQLRARQEGTALWLRRNVQSGR